MNIDDLTIGEARQLAATFGAATLTPTASHRYIGKYVVIRTYSAGVHVGTLYSINHSASGMEAILTGCRRIYSWSGAFTLSAVATDGIKSGKMAVSLPEMAVQNVIEIIPCTDAARLNLVGFPVYTP